MYATFEVRRYETAEDRGETIWRGDDADIGREYLDDRAVKTIDPAAGEMEAVVGHDGAIYALMVSP